MISRSPRMAGQHPPDRLGPGVLARRRSRPAVDDHRHTGLRDGTPHGIEQRIGRVVPAHLHMRLEDPCPARQFGAHIRRGAVLRKERRGPQAVGRTGREVGRPAVQPLRHPRLVRIDHRREGPHPEAAQHRQPLVLLEPVGDRPFPADQRPGRVEVRPDLRHHPLGHEVRMHIDQPRQPQLPPERADPLITLRHAVPLPYGSDHYSRSRRPQPGGRPLHRPTRRPGDTAPPAGHHAPNRRPALRRHHTPGRHHAQPTPRARHRPRQTPGGPGRRHTPGVDSRGRCQAPTDAPRPADTTPSHRARHLPAPSI